MDYRHQKLICRGCGKRKKECICNCKSKKVAWWLDTKYLWCFDYGIGEYCNDCKNKFECFTNLREYHANG